MADKKEVDKSKLAPASKTLRIVDDDGSTLGYRSYSGEVNTETGEAYGGSLFENSYNNKRNRVYKSNDENQEDWLPVEDATVSIGTQINGDGTADIVLSGPEWYAKQVQESDWFKKNYSESKSYRALVQASLDNPNGTFIDPNDDTKTITYSEALNQYNDAFNQYAEAYKQLAHAKDLIYSGFNTELSDGQTQIAGTSYDKGDYDKNGAVYIPKWLQEKHDFTKYDSWNAQTQTISAGDFFDHYYTSANLDENGIREAKALARERLQGFASYGVMAADDEDGKKILESDDYKEELARTISMASIMSENKADTDFIVGSAMFISGVGAGLLEAASNFVSGAGQFLTDIVKLPMALTKDFFVGVGVEDGTAQMLTTTMEAPLALTYTALSALGEFFGAAWQTETSGDSLKDWVDGMSADLDGIAEMTGDNAWTKLRKEFTDGMNVFYQGAGDLSDTVHAGRFVGNVIFKIVENLVLLNRVGGAVAGKLFGEGLSSATAATGIAAAGSAQAVGGVASVKGLSNIIKLIATTPKSTLASGFVKAAAFSTNVVTQGVLETVLDDDDVVHNLLLTGDPEVIGVVWKNTAFNAMGEVAGWGTSKIMDTTAAKVITNPARRVTNKLGSWKDSGMAKLMKKVAGDNAKEATKNKIKYLEKSAQIKKEIAAVKTLEGVSSEGATAVTKNIEKQEALVLERVKLENAYDMMNGSITNAMKGIENQLDQQVVKDYFEQATALIKEETELIDAGVLTKSDVAGSLLSKESSNYLSLKSQYEYLTTKQSMLALNGESLTPKDLTKLEAITEKFNYLTNSIDPAYLIKLNNLSEALGKYQSQLNLFKLDNGLYATQAEYDAARDLIDKGWWGENGERYVHTQRWFEGENYAEKFFKNLSHEGQRGAKIADEFGADIDADFVDPLLLANADLYRSASINVQRNWQNALLHSSGVSENVVATAKDVELAKNFKKVNSNLNSSFKVSENSSLDKVIRESFDHNEFFAKAFNRTNLYENAKDAARQKVRNLEAERNKVLGLGRKSTVKTVVSDFSADDIADINSMLDEGLEIPTYSLAGVRASDFNGWFESLPKTSKDHIKKLLDAQGKKLNVTNTKALFATEPNLQTTLQRNYLLSNEKLMKQKPVQDMLLAKRTAQLDARQATILSENTKKLNRAQGRLKKLEGEGGEDFAVPKAGKEFNDGIMWTTNEIVDSMEEIVAKNAAAGEFIKEMEKAGVDPDIARTYLTLKQLSSVSGKKIKEALFRGRFANAELKEAATGVKLKSGKPLKLYDETMENYVNNAADAIYKNIQSEYNNILKYMTSEGYGDLLENGEVYKRVSGYMKELGAKVSAHDIVPIPNVDAGEIQYVKVDPITADLFFLRPGAFTINVSDYGSLAQKTIKFFNRTNRLFQWGTTGFSLTSFTNQWFRDSLGAITAGGARPFLDFGVGVEASRGLFGRHFSGTITDDFVARNGARIADGLRKEWGEERWEAFVKAAQDNGVSVERAATQYAVSDNGYRVLPGQEQLTTIGYYSGGTAQFKFQREMNETREKLQQASSEYGQSLFGKAGVKKSQAAVDKALDKVTSFQIGGTREVLYRQGVYTSAYGRALDAGMSISDASEYATRFALDATIDFARPLMIGDSIAKSVPYFGAAVNGFESFWRLLEIDPVGVAGRFTGGIIIPGMSAIAKTLDNPDDRKIYEQIPEYEKEDSLLFVSNGTLIKIPLPQEMSVFFAPFRQAVEKAHEANDHDWLSLISSDLLQISPVDLSGFVDLDHNDLLGDPTFTDRIERGVEKAASGLMPAAAKAVYKAISGRDPYTGQAIDKSYYYYDDEGNKQIMDTSQSTFCNWLSEQWGDSITASSAYSIFKDLLGRSGLAIADTITTTLTVGASKGAVEGAAAGAVGALNMIGKGTVGVITPDVYNQGRSDWNEAVRQLQSEKATLLADKDFQSLLQSIAFEDDADKLKKLNGQKAEYVEQFQKKVCTMVENLKKKYPGMYTRTRQGSVMALLNMNFQPYGVNTAESRNMSKELYYQGKQDAINSMQAMGFGSTEDNSILGQGRYNRDGEYEFQWNQPLTILNMGNVVFGQGDLNVANIQSLLDANKITRGEMYGPTWNSLTTKAQKKEYKAAWNKKVIAVLAPYITKHGVDAVLNNFAVRDLLDNYIFVDNPYKTKDYLYSIFTGGDV